MSTVLQQLRHEGVSVWLDDLSRELIDSGQLQRLITEGVLGITTNPTIFASALAKGDAYEEQVRKLVASGASVEEAVFAITTSDVQRACDLLAPVYTDTQGLNGRVSLEVDPRMARDAAGTIASARALWAAVDRPNLYIKIPATVEGLEAITTVLGEGISVNVTLIFSLQRYRAVMDAFLAGVEQAQAGGRDLATLRPCDLATLASVASFFVSRVDTEVDQRLKALDSAEAQELTAQAGLANARLAYQAYEEVFTGPRWQTMAEAGVKPQRPLWASTGVKDPNLPDTLYVTELVAPGTVNTMPGKTLTAVIDHGEVVGDTVRGRYAAAQDLMEHLARLGISYEEVVEQLEGEGLDKFEASWGELLDTVQGELTRVGQETR